MNRSSWITLLISLALIAGAAGLFYTLFEKKTDTTRFDYSPEARLNDLLAARRFLKRMGIPAENMATPSPASSLPPSTDVIMLVTKRLTVDARTRDTLLDWAKAGGHLILTARSETVTDGLFDIFESFNENEVKADKDDFLETLGLETIQHSSTSEEYEDYEANGVSFANSDDFVWVSFNQELRLKSNKSDFHVLAGDQDGDFVLTRRWGSGNVTVFSDRRVVHNRKIDNKDHARFLLEMVNLGNRPNMVWLIGEDNMPSLFAWLWKYANELMISLIILLLMVLYTASRRFGPVIDVHPPQRRRLLEHIQASGRFLWRHHHYEQLLLGMQHNLKHEMAMKHPGIQVMGASAAAQRLAGFIDMNASEIQQVLGSIEVNNKEEFTSTVHLYERLRKQL